MNRRSWSIFYPKGMLRISSDRILSANKYSSVIRLRLSINGYLSLTRLILNYQCLQKTLSHYPQSWLGSLALPLKIRQTMMILNQTSLSVILIVDSAGKNLLLAKRSTIPLKSRLISQRLRNYGSILVNHLQKPRHIIRETWLCHRRIPMQISWRASGLPPWRLQLLPNHTIQKFLTLLLTRQASIKMLSMLRAPIPLSRCPKRRCRTTAIQRHRHPRSGHTTANTQSQTMYPINTSREAASMLILKPCVINVPFKKQRPHRFRSIIIPIRVRAIQRQQHRGERRRPRHLWCHRKHHQSTTTTKAISITTTM